jgi:CDP-paratose 2-epimerase
MSRIVDTIRKGIEGPGETPRGKGPRPAGEPRHDDLGIVSYFHLNDRRAVEIALAGMDRLGIERLRTSISWADWYREGGREWYEWLIPLLTERFDVLPCVLYTPPDLGLLPKTSSPPRDPHDYAAFVDYLLTEHAGRFSHIELWNEPNNYIEWDWTVDPEWKIFAEMIALASAKAAEHGVKSVLGGMSPFDPNWLDLMYKRGAMEHVDAIGVHGFPGTWEAVWEGWDGHVARVREVADAHSHEPELWITECGFSTWSHDEFRMVLEFVDVMTAPADRIYWYSARDLDPTYETLDGFHADERAYHFGLFHTDGTPKLLARTWEREGLAGVRRLAEVGSAGRTDHEVMPYLITGGAGFVGTNLADRLCSEGRPVVVLDNLSRPGVEQNLTWLKEKHGDLVSIEIGDVRDVFAVRRALAGCEAVFHLAAQVAVTMSLNDPNEDMEINLRGTLNVLEEIRRLAEPPPVLFTSTNKVYGGLYDVELEERSLRYEPVDEKIAMHGITEGRPLEFCSPYGCSKGAAEQYVLDYARSFGLKTCVFRMSCIYGPHQFGNEDQGWVAHFLISALRHQGITIFGDGKQVRDILWVEDLIDAMLLAIDDPNAHGHAFNIGGGASNAASLLEIIDLIEELEGTRPLTSFEGWRIADQKFYVSDITRFHDAFGWKPRVSVEVGLGALHRWLSEHRVPAKAAAPR